MHYSSKFCASENIERFRLPLATLGDFLRAFEENTGWPLRFVPGNPPEYDPEVLWAARVGTSLVSAGELRLSLGGSTYLAGRRVDLEAAAALANSYATLLCELLQTREAWQRCEAELSPMVSTDCRHDLDPTAGSLESLLQQAAETLSGDAAALYLLDDATSKLRLCAHWGKHAKLPLSPSRTLASAIADLEALAGHAVTLQTPNDMDSWNVPANCGWAVCLPVSTSSQIFGTLWVFGERTTTFSDQQLNTAEMIATRLAWKIEGQQWRKMPLSKLAGFTTAAAEVLL